MLISLSFPHSGDEDLSFGYDARGRKVTAGKEEEFGEPFSEGDVIGCYAVSDTSCCFYTSLTFLNAVHVEMPF